MDSDGDGDGEMVNNDISSSSSSPGFGETTLLNDDGGNASTALSSSYVDTMDASIRRRAINRHSGSTTGNNPASTSSTTHKGFSFGSGDHDDDNDNEASARHTAGGERESTPTLTSMASNPPHLARSNSLGLGFGAQAQEPAAASQPAMYIAPSSSSSSSSSLPHVNQQNHPFNSHTSSADDLVKIEKSPSYSTASSAHFGEEEDDKIFDEAKEKGNIS